MERLCYTYLLRFKPTGQLYYGVRWGRNCHPAELWITYFSSSRKVKRLVEKHGADAFEWQVRRVFSDPKRARLCEARVHNAFDVAGSARWLNLRNGVAKFSGKQEITDETRRKMSAKARARPPRPQSLEEREKRSAALKGIRKSATHIANNAAARIGNKQSAETIAQRVEKNRGKIRSEEQRSRMSMAQRNRSEEQRSRMSMAQKGLKMFANVKTFELSRFRSAPSDDWLPWNNNGGIIGPLKATYPRDMFVKPE